MVHNWLFWMVFIIVRTTAQMTTCGKSRGAQNNDQEELMDLIRQTNLEAERIISERIGDLSQKSTSVIELVSERQANETANLGRCFQSETASLRSMVKNFTAMVEGTDLDVIRGMEVLGDTLQAKFEQNEAMMANITDAVNTLNRKESESRLYEWKGREKLCC